MSVCPGCLGCSFCSETMTDKEMSEWEAGQEKKRVQECLQENFPTLQVKMIDYFLKRR